MIEHGTLVGGQISIDMTSIENTDQEGKWKANLEGHLKSDDFFNVEKFPKSIVFYKGKVFHIFEKETNFVEKSFISKIQNQLSM